MRLVCFDFIFCKHFLSRRFYRSEATKLEKFSEHFFCIFRRLEIVGVEINEDSQHVPSQNQPKKLELSFEP